MLFLGNRKRGIVNVKMIITEEKILSNIDKVEKLINPNSKKQIIQLEDDAYFKDLIDSIKVYLFEYPNKKNFPGSVYNAAHKLVEYATDQFEENTKQVEVLIRQRENNINVANELKLVLESVQNKEKDWKNKIKEYEETHYKKPIAKFRSLTKSVKTYEILNNITLILHIQAEESVLQDIMENIYDLKSLGRSEDFVDVEEIKLVDLVEPEEKIISSYSAYVNYQDTKPILNNRKAGNIFFFKSRGKQGTKYYFGTEYKIEKGKRIFLQDKKVPVVYVSNHRVDKKSKNVWIDNAGDEQYIVNFLQK